MNDLKMPVGVQQQFHIMCFLIEIARVDIFFEYKQFQDQAQLDYAWQTEHVVCVPSVAANIYIQLSSLPTPNTAAFGRLKPYIYIYTQDPHSQ